ncbi:hypothetical protein FDP41_007112 [Naegleria fowleri]|uniref:FAM86 N-terminal domain-containing protein n=1 Tax=Naegleria fowleri TaxID=5763 RepID=A0A6A5BJ35_NAEFO|nr:uncharacterized protein FDP41_007112 [Naegleria fowleri]KAF0973725.1 hypothetical protein FDP41_007112 [Naegleria fowleri]
MDASPAINHDCDHESSKSSSSPHSEKLNIESARTKNSDSSCPKTLSAFRSYSISNSKQFLNYFRNEFCKQFPQTPFVSLEAQKIFYHEIIHNFLSEKFPIPSQFILNVIKYYIELIESDESGANHEGIYDPLIEEFSQLMIHHKESESHQTKKEFFYDYRVEESSFRVYDFLKTWMSEHEDQPIVVRIWPQFVNVGMSLWSAGFMLIEYILSHLDDFKYKNITELGSGVGLLGLILMTCIDKEHRGEITLTDYLPCVLENCAYCFSLNNIPYKLCNLDAFMYLPTNTMTPHDSRDFVRLMKLDWCSFTQIEIQQLKDTDILVAADVTYDISVVESLAEVTHALFEQNHNLTILFAITKRTEKTFERFVKEMDKRNMCLSREIETNFPYIFQVNDRETVKLYEMRGENITI